MSTVIVPLSDHDRVFENARELEFPVFSKSHLDRPTWDLRFRDRFGRTIVVKGPYVVIEEKVEEQQEQKAA
jgi:hypothetical protein